MAASEGRSPMRRLFSRYGLPYLGWYVAGVVALGLTNELSLGIPIRVGHGIDALGDPATRGDAWTAAWVVAAMGTAVLVVRWASRLLFFTPGRLIEARIMRDVFESALRQQPDFFVRHSAGDLTSRITSDVQQARLLFGFAALGLINTVVAVLIAGAKLMQLSSTLGLLVAAPLLIGFAVTARTVDRLRYLQRAYQEQLAAVSDHALASFQGIAAVHAFGAGPALGRRFREVNAALLRTMVTRSGFRVVIGPLLGLVAAIDVFLVLWVGGPRALAGELTAGEVIAFVAIIGYLIGPLRQLTFTLSVIRQASASLERLDAVLSAVPFRPDLDPGHEPLPAPSRPPALRLAGLTYRYPGADRDALHDVTVDVPAGGVLGVFGPTGSGKTTLVRCLLRLCDPPPHQILVDGVDVRSIDLPGWRAAAALVPQRAYLYSESIRDNILLGADAAELDPLIEATQLRVDLAALPDGAATVVGEAGLTLSGGQRQRVALARGLARDARVLVLDDVLSAVDPTTEAALIQTLRTRAGRPTTVIVSNRISALRHADVIVVLDEGRMVAEGRHTELIARDGPYRDACAHQAESTEPA
jgi:ATP-binding cassette subfamily B protein